MTIRQDAQDVLARAYDRTFRATLCGVALGLSVYGLLVLSCLAWFDVVSFTFHLRYLILIILALGVLFGTLRLIIVATGSTRNPLAVGAPFAGITLIGWFLWLAIEWTPEDKPSPRWILAASAAAYAPSILLAAISRIRGDGEAEPSGGLDSTRELTSMMADSEKEKRDIDEVLPSDADIISLREAMRRNVERLAEVEAQLGSGGTAPPRRDLYLSPGALLWLAAFVLARITASPFADPKRYFSSVIHLISILNLAVMVTAQTGSVRKTLVLAGQFVFLPLIVLFLGFGLREWKFFAGVAAVYAAMWAIWLLYAWATRHLSGPAASRALRTRRLDIIQPLRELSPALGRSQGNLLVLEKMRAGDIDILDAARLAAVRERTRDDDEIRASMRAWASDDKIAAAQEEVRRNYLRLVEVSEQLEAEVERFKEAV